MPTLPLFVHERLSTQAVLETLKRRHPERGQTLDLFGESDKSIGEKIRGAYEHLNGWQNRLMLGDSLQVMHSLLDYEGLGGQVQMIYMDPPYGVKFGGNFQPFVRRRDVKDGDDDALSREPEMVRAYRDTWELGIHSFLTYLRDRLLLAREMLHPSGSIFVQMSTPTCTTCARYSTRCLGRSVSSRRSVSRPPPAFRPEPWRRLATSLLWYARDPGRLKVRKLFEEQAVVPGEGNARWVLLPDGSYRGVSATEKRGEAPLPEGARLYKPGDMQGQGTSREPQPFEFEGQGVRAGREFALGRPTTRRGSNASPPRAGSTWRPTASSIDASPRTSPTRSGATSGLTP